MIINTERITNHVGMPEIFAMARTTSGYLFTLNVGLESTDVDKYEDNEEGIEYSFTQINVRHAETVSLKDIVKIVVDVIGDVRTDELKRIVQKLHIDDYGTIVSAIIRSKYSADDVEAIILNGSDVDEHKKEYEALQEWRVQAKKIAQDVIA